MAYHTHYIAVVAHNGGHACDMVDRILMDWMPSTDNYYHVIGAVGERGENYINDADRWLYDTVLSPQSISRQLRHDLQNARNAALAKVEEVLGGQSINTFLLHAIADTRAYSRMLSLKSSVCFLAEFSRLDVSVNQFDVLKHEFLPMEYEETGVTNHIPDKGIEATIAEKFVVIADVHS